MLRLPASIEGLPQLAVLAKILCLLMVVMCGAVPSTVRSVSLYSTCSRGNVTVYGRTVKSTVRNDYNEPYQKVTTVSEDFSMKIYLYAEKSKRYICFSKRWKLITLPKKRRNEYCLFREDYVGRYLRYQSVMDSTRYIGFNRNGKPLSRPLDLEKNSPRHECFNFLRLTPNSGVEVHNSIVASSKGGMKQQHRGIMRATPEHLRKSIASKARITLSSSSSSAATKNSLIPSSENLSSLSSSGSSNRLVKTSTSTHQRQQQQKSQQQQQQQLPHHRHRHSNSWRRHGSSSSRSSSSSDSSNSSSNGSLFIEPAANSKY